MGDVGAVLSTQKRVKLLVQHFMGIHDCCAPLGPELYVWDVAPLAIRRTRLGIVY